MSASCDFHQTWKQLVKYLESVPLILDSLKQILPVILDLDLLRLKEFPSTRINLKGEYELSSGQLKAIACDVVALIIIVKSIREMADDRMKERIRVEVRKQIEKGTTHFDRQDIDRFPELNDFLAELLERVRNVDNLSGKIEQSSRDIYRDLPNRNRMAENKAENGENSAWLRKVVFGAAAVGFVGVATGGLGLGIGALVVGVQSTALGLTAAVGGGSALAAAGSALAAAGSGLISRKYSQEEEKFCKAKEKFERLNRTAVRLQQVTGEIQRYTRLFKTSLDACFIREQPPLLRQIPRSLEKLFAALRFEGVNFENLRERAERIENELTG